MKIVILFLISFHLTCSEQTIIEPWGNGSPAIHIPANFGKTAHSKGPDFNVDTFRSSDSAVQVYQGHNPKEPMNSENTESRKVLIIGQETNVFTHKVGNSHVAEVRFPIPPPEGRFAKNTPNYKGLICAVTIASEHQEKTEYILNELIKLKLVWP